MKTWSAVLKNTAFVSIVVAILVPVWSIERQGRISLQLAKQSRNYELATYRYKEIMILHSKFLDVPPPEFQQLLDAIRDPKAAGTFFEITSKDYLTLRDLANRYRPLFDDEIFAPARTVQDSVEAMLEHFFTKPEIGMAVAERERKIKYEWTEKGLLDFGKKLSATQLAFRDSLESVIHAQLKELKIQQHE